MSARDEWQDAIKRLYVDAGKPPSREVAARCDVSHASVNDMVRGRRLPTWPTAVTVIEALDGSVGLFVDLWAGAELEAKLGRMPNQALPAGLSEIVEELVEIRAALERIADALEKGTG